MKKVDSRVTELIHRGVASGHRSMFVLVGDRGREQVVNLHFVLSKARVSARPSVLVTEGCAPPMLPPHAASSPTAAQAYLPIPPPMEMLPPTPAQRRSVAEGDPSSPGGGSARRSSSMLHARLREQHAMLLEAQAQARRAKEELRRSQRVWQLLQLAAPVVCALAAGLALGGLVGRPARRR